MPFRRRRSEPCVSAPGSSLFTTACSHVPASPATPPPLAASPSTTKISSDITRSWIDDFAPSWSFAGETPGIGRPRPMESALAGISAVLPPPPAGRSHGGNVCAPDRSEGAAPRTRRRTRFRTRRLRHLPVPSFHLVAARLLLSGRSLRRSGRARGRRRARTDSSGVREGRSREGGDGLLDDPGVQRGGSRALRYSRAPHLLHPLRALVDERRQADPRRATNASIPGGGQTSARVALRNSASRSRQEASGPSKTPFTGIKTMNARKSLSTGILAVCLTLGSYAAQGAGDHFKALGPNKGQAARDDSLFYPNDFEAAVAAHPDPNA